MERRKGSKKTWDDDIDMEFLGHNRTNFEKVDEAKEEIYRRIFANGPDDGDGLGSHSVNPTNPTKLTPPPPPGKSS